MLTLGEARPCKYAGMRGLRVVAVRESKRLDHLDNRRCRRWYERLLVYVDTVLDRRLQVSLQCVELA
jgi:hypothetical protein